MKAKELHEGKLYLTIHGEARFKGFDGYGFAVCVRDGTGEKYQLRLADVLSRVPEPAPAPAPTPTPAQGDSQCR